MQDKMGVSVIAKVMLIFVCLHFSNRAVAQQPYFPFKHFSTVNGLSQNHVLSILQDRQGFMWFGTLEGLNRFDGYEFTVFLHDSKDSTSLVQNFTASILEDRDGVIWIGTGGGLSRFNRATNNFTSYKHDPLNKNSISGGLINEMLEDEKGNFWIALTTGYLDYFDRQQNKFIHYQLEKDFTDITSLLADRDGNLWIGSRAGLAVMDQSRKTIHQFRHQQNDRTSLTSSNVNDIFQDDAANIWIATEGGLNQYDPHHKNFIRHVHSDSNPNTISVNVVKCMTQDIEGRLWIGTENGGLDVWDRSANNFYHYDQNDSDLQGISDNSIYSLYTDLHGNIWVGTNKSGVDFYDRFRKPFTVYQHIYEEKTSLSHNKINAIAEQPGKGFWVATDGGGLNFFNEAEGTFKAYQYDPMDPQSIPGNFLVDVLWDEADECLWIATWGAGLARMDIKTGKFKRYKHNADDPFSIASNNLWRLYQDKTGRLYIGSVGNGLSIYDKASSKFTNYGPQNGLAEENVVSVYIDKKNVLWLGGWGNGLSLMDLSAKSSIPLPPGLTGKSNESIFADSLNRIWVSGNEGMQCYDERNDTTFSLTTDDGLPETSVNGMTIDDHGNFWLATNKGIVQYNLAKRQSNVFSIEDGLPANQFVPRLLKTSNGKMYFGSINGLVVFHPDSIKQNPVAPVALITDFKIFNKSVFAGGEDKILDKHISETKEIWLPFEYNFITLNFVALNYTSPQGNEYAYMLEGFDKDWVNTVRQRSATYTNLDPGDYVFKVKASNNDGLWNEEGTSLVIHVLPAWWATIWFRALLIGSVVGSAILFYRFRTRNIANQNKKLSALVKERTIELTELNAAVTKQNETLQERQEEIQTQNEELKQSQEEVMAQRDVVWAQNQKLEEAGKIIEKQNQEIKLRNENLEMEVQSRTKELVEYNQQLEQFAFISAHNLRAPVARLLGLGHILDLESKDNNPTKIVSQKMVSSAKELDRVVRDLNTILEIRKNNHSIISEVRFDEELSLVKQYIEKEIEDTKCIIDADFSKAPKIRSVKPYVESVLQNLLSNAIKYRNPERVPVIALHTKPVDDYICLTVSDNGLGIDTTLYKEKVFTLYQRFHTHVEGKGLGLYLVKTQILALGGKIELESKVNEGTTFKVYFKKQVDV